MDTKEKIAITFYIVVLFVVFTTATFVKTVGLIYGSLLGNDDTIVDGDNLTLFGKFVVGLIFAILILLTSSS
tara:strand:- start:1028 stop:1243 length:216 start_codon:yes stop_codon:yes gene_type:complete